MTKLGKIARRTLLIASIPIMIFSSSGCTPFALLGFTLADGFLRSIYPQMLFWEAGPIIPVSPYFSQKLEDAYWEEERYGKVPVLDPVEGEHAPLFCLDPPSPDEVMRALPDKADGGFAFLAETSRKNVRIVVEPIVDKLEECRFYPLVGPARLHKCHYKCTVYYEKTIRSDWPIPFTHTDLTQEVVYIDHDHLIRCAGPATP